MVSWLVSSGHRAGSAGARLRPGEKCRAGRVARELRLSSYDRGLCRVALNEGDAECGIGPAAKQGRRSYAALERQ